MHVYIHIYIYICIYTYRERCICICVDIKACLELVTLYKTCCDACVANGGLNPFGLDPPL